MADQRIAYNEYMVGAGHPTKADTLNRHANVEHNADGTHKMTGGAAGVLYYHDGTKLTAFGPGATTKILVGGGAAAPVWTEATGSGAPVRATSPTLVTPILGTPTSGTLTNCTGYPADAQGAENNTETIQYPIPTAAYMLKAATDGSPATATNTDAQVADAVSKAHTQNTDTGTTATSFKINTGGSEADLQTTGLTADRDYTLPDIDTMLAGSVLLAQNTCEIIEYTS